MCCVLTAQTGRALPNPGRALQSKAPAGRSGSPAHQASAFGNGLGRQSKSLIEIRRNPIAFGSSTSTPPSNSLILVPLFDLKLLTGFGAGAIGTSSGRH